MPRSGGTFHSSEVGRRLARLRWHKQKSSAPEEESRARDKKFLEDFMKPVPPDVSPEPPPGLVVNLGDMLVRMQHQHVQLPVLPLTLAERKRRIRARIEYLRGLASPADTARAFAEVEAMHEDSPPPFEPHPWWDVNGWASGAEG